MKRILEEKHVPLAPALPLSTPFVINVDPASACNFRCRFCFHSGNVHFPKGIMDYGLYEDIIGDILDFDRPIKTLRLYAFGEPLVNSHFADMVRYAKELGVAEDIDTTTNGNLLEPDLNMEIISAGISRINISVAGVRDEHFFEFCGKRIDFNRYVENIAHLYENRKSCTIFVKINGDVISKEDQQEFLNIFTPISDGAAIEHVMNCWYDFDMHGIETNKSVGVYGQPLTEVDICPYIFYSFCAQYDGVVSACFLDWNRRLVLGDVKKESLLSIWNGEKMREMRLMMLTGNRLSHPICGKCNQLIAGQPTNIDHIAEELLEKI